MPVDAAAQPSAWVRRFSALIRPGGQVLDLACGGGRHCRFLAGAGFQVLGVDHDALALAGLSTVPGVRTLAADLEAGPWPLAAERFDAVVVTNYLHRPLFPALVQALAPCGLLIYETFAVGNERYGRPSNPDFLLRPGELLEQVSAGLAVVAFEEALLVRSTLARVQRLCAVAPGPEALGWPPERWGQREGPA